MYAAETATSHVSIELGHLYPKDYAEGFDYLVDYFKEVAIFAGAIAANAARRYPSPQISTCFMADDYGKLHHADTTPEIILNQMVLPAAAKAGLAIDYIGREAACAPLADELIEGLREPGRRPGRPHANVSKWLSNNTKTADGTRSDKALQTNPVVRPPDLDIELFSNDKDGSRIYACSTLAAVWQAMRLGWLDTPPHLFTADASGGRQFGDDWDALPAVMQLQPDAVPFAAERIHSILGKDYWLTEAAVRYILEHSDLNPDFGQSSYCRQYV